MIGNMFEKDLNKGKRLTMQYCDNSLFLDITRLIFQASGQTSILDPQVYSVSEILTISPTIAL